MNSSIPEAIEHERTPRLHRHDLAETDLPVSTYAGYERRRSRRRRLPVDPSYLQVTEARQEAARRAALEGLASDLERDL